MIGYQSRQDGLPAESSKKIMIFFPYDQFFIDQTCMVKMAVYYMLAP